jgi:putative colanic acid biosynthesis acetyltransferase WcaF
MRICMNSNCRSGETSQRVDLRLTSNRGFDPGRPFVTRALWLLVEALLLLNPVVTSCPLKRWILRRFGASIGSGVLIKPNVHVKYPWRLTVGDYSWIGERVWIDNFTHVVVGAHACVSQGAYLCTGNHDWGDPGMGRFVQPITIEDGAWVGAFARLAPGVRVGSEAVVGLGAVLLQDVEPGAVYMGNPATKVGERRLRDEAGPARPVGKSSLT